MPEIIQLQLFESNKILAMTAKLYGERHPHIAE